MNELNYYVDDDDDDMMLGVSVSGGSQCITLSIFLVFYLLL